MTLTEDGSVDIGVRNGRYVVGLAGVWNGATIALNYMVNSLPVPFRDVDGTAVTFTVDGGVEVVVPGRFPEIRLITTGSGASTAVRVDVQEIRV